MGKTEKSAGQSEGKHAGGNKGIENLRPCKDTETAKARGKLGGIESGKAKREKKLMSQIYAEFLESEFEVEIDDGKKQKLTGEKLVNEVMRKVVMRCDSASVSLLKEIRETTEGNKLKLSGSVRVVASDVDEDL